MKIGLFWLQQIYMVLVHPAIETQKHPSPIEKNSLHFEYYIPKAYLYPSSQMKFLDLPLNCQDIFENLALADSSNNTLTHNIFQRPTQTS